MEYLIALGLGLAAGYVITKKKPTLKDLEAQKYQLEAKVEKEEAYKANKQAIKQLKQRSKQAKYGEAKKIGKSIFKEIGIIGKKLFQTLTTPGEQPITPVKTKRKPRHHQPKPRHEEEIEDYDIGYVRDTDSFQDIGILDIDEMIQDPTEMIK